MFRRNPAVKGLGLKFYAGAVLRTPDGVPLGTLCVMDKVARTLTDPQKRQLQARRTRHPALPRQEHIGLLCCALPSLVSFPLCNLLRFPRTESAPRLAPQTNGCSLPPPLPCLFLSSDPRPQH